MLEDVFLTVLNRQGQLKSLVQGEIERLKEKGYLTEDPEALAAEFLERIEEHASKARETTVPLLKGLGDTLRQALDIPSRTEILALTQALERQAKQTDTDSV